MSDQTVEERAGAMGWVPQEKFRGDPEKWVDAETFVQRGEQVMPILKHNNEKLQAEIASLKGELGKVTSLFQASQEAVEELKKFNSEATRRAAEQARKDLLAELKQARDDGDLEAEEDVRVELDKVTRSLEEAESKQDGSGKAGDDTGTNAKTLGAEAAKEFNAWLGESGIDWWGKDRRKTSLALGIAEELRTDPANAGLVGRPFYDKVNAELNKMFATRGAPDRVEGAGAGGVQHSGGKSYADLPADAKAACDRQGKRLVGPGRAYKDEASWRKKYAELYFGS